MKSIKLLFALLLLAMSMTALADDFEGVIVNTGQNKWASSKFFAKGIEAINDDDLEMAIDMFEKEVKLHPSNGYAICNLAHCQFLTAKNEMFTDIYSEDSSEQEIAAAKEKGNKGMSAVLPLLNKGISMLPSADGEAQCQAYRLKSSMLCSLAEVDSAEVAASYEKAIAIHPCVEAYEDHINFFFNNTDVVLADLKMLRKLNPDDPSYIKLQTLLAYRDKDYDQCLTLYEEHNDILNRDGENVIDEQMAAIQLMSLKSLGRDEKAMNLALKYIEEYELGDAISLYLQMAKNNPELAEMQLKQRLFAETGDERVWNTMLGRVMESQKDYRRALESLFKVEKVAHESFIFYEIAMCYYMLADTDNALKYIDVATLLDGGEEYLSTRDDILINMGKASKVISEKKMGMELIKNASGGEISQRLTLADLLLQERDYSQAADVMASIIDSTYSAKAYSIYAEALKGVGRTAEAQKYLQKITELDAFPYSDIVYIAPAYHALGREEGARNQAESLSQCWEDYQKDPDNEEKLSSCYDIAVVYAQLGDSDKAMEYLEKHFLHDDMPYNFGQIDRDWRLDSVRELPQFKALVEKYRKQWKSNAVSNK